MIDFDPRFEIMPGTKAAGGQVAKADPYEAVPRHSIAESMYSIAISLKTPTRATESVVNCPTMKE